MELSLFFRAFLRERKYAIFVTSQPLAATGRRLIVRFARLIQFLAEVRIVRRRTACIGASRRDAEAGYAKCSEARGIGIKTTFCIDSIASASTSDDEGSSISS
jgi:hypothetical protein